jgi:hypothetical protein
MAKILISDFELIDLETFLHELAPAKLDTVQGGYFEPWENFLNWGIFSGGRFLSSPDGVISNPGGVLSTPAGILQY